MSGALSLAGTALGLAGSFLFKQSYGINPIILTGGIAANQAGGVLSVASLTGVGGLAAVAGALTDPLQDNVFQYIPLPGATLIDDQIGQYPFANQAVAANAVIAGPTKISLLMIAPVTSSTGGYAAKLAIFTALQASLRQHRNLGGLYTVATPAVIFDSCILTRLVDVSTGETKQTQIKWQWDFERPLVTLAQAQQALNNQMSKIQQGLPTTGAPSGPGLTVGTPNTNTLPNQGGQSSGGG